MPHLVDSQPEVAHGPAAVEAEGDRAVLGRRCGLQGPVLQTVAWRQVKPHLDGIGGGAVLLSEGEDRRRWQACKCTADGEEKRTSESVP